MNAHRSFDIGYRDLHYLLIKMIGFFVFRTVTPFVQNDVIIQRFDGLCPICIKYPDTNVATNFQTHVISDSVALIIIILCTKLCAMDGIHNLFVASYVHALKNK